MRFIDNELSKVSKNILNVLNESKFTEANQDKALKESAASVKKQINTDKPEEAPKETKEALVKKVQKPQIPAKSLKEDLGELQSRVADLQAYLDDTPEVPEDERASIQAEIDELLDEINYMDNGVDMEESALTESEEVEGFTILSADFDVNNDNKLEIMCKIRDDSGFATNNKGDIFTLTNQFYIGDDREEYEIVPDACYVVGDFKQSIIDKWDIGENGELPYLDESDAFGKVITEAEGRAIEAFKNSENMEESALTEAEDDDSFNLFQIEWNDMINIIHEMQPKTNKGRILKGRLEKLCKSFIEDVYDKAKLPESALTENSESQIKGLKKRNESEELTEAPNPENAEDNKKIRDVLLKGPNSKYYQDVLDMGYKVTPDKYNDDKHQEWIVSNPNKPAYKSNSAGKSSDLSSGSWQVDDSRSVRTDAVRRMKAARNKQIDYKNFLDKDYSPRSTGIKVQHGSGKDPGMHSSNAYIKNDIHDTPTYDDYNQDNLKSNYTQTGTPNIRKFRDAKSKVRKYEDPHFNPYSYSNMSIYRDSNTYGVRDKESLDRGVSNAEKDLADFQASISDRLAQLQAKIDEAKKERDNQTKQYQQNKDTVNKLLKRNKGGNE